MMQSKHKLKVAEIFYSLQGEGRYMGVPSVFLRTFGCNFMCEGFGMPKGQKSDERTGIDPNSVDNYSDLPLVHTGCDSYASWDVRFKHLSPVLAVEDVAKAILATTPAKSMRGIHLVITGGEPLLGWQRAYPDLITILTYDYGLENITFETNGTQELSSDFIGFLASSFDQRKFVTFMVSPKLPGVSGEKWEDAICPKIVKTYDRIGAVFLKFVVTKDTDIAEIEQAVQAYKDAGVDRPVYLMAVGGTCAIHEEHKRAVADLALSKGWRYSSRMQVDLWKNAWGT